MHFLQMNYYVGLLSAAALHGAGHQQPQQFQVMVTSILKPIKRKKIDLKFFQKKHLDSSQIIKLKTSTGYLCVSTPEVTAIDLVTYSKSVGSFNNIIAIFSDLIEKINPDQLIGHAKNNIPISILQRMGLLLDFVEAHEITKGLHQWLFDYHTPKVIPLRSDKQFDNKNINQKWLVAVNEELEIDV
ncbi:MAG: type IV toxin-antitoxin system AbiEi family antitoxin [Oligoflexia bacterium]|nr:type IV toxin-antitoxin system AbiEi family antitoxin [Oligoflexia bacterium]